MITETFYVPDISCHHCVMTIEREVTEDVDGVREVSADEETQRVTVSYETPATHDSIAAFMAEIGYPIAETVN